MPAGITVPPHQHPHRFKTDHKLFRRLSDPVLYTVACAVLSATNVFLLLKISYLQNSLNSALSEKQEGGRRRIPAAAVLYIVLIVQCIQCS